jgi:hypothetical protein
MDDLLKQLYNLIEMKQLDDFVKLFMRAVPAGLGFAK